MKQLLRLIFILSLLVSVQTLASTTVFKVLEQDSDGTTSHRAFDRSSIGDGLDPVLQFILLDAPVDPATSQLLWEASEKPIPWGRQSEDQDYRMVEYAFLPQGSRLEYRIHSNATGDEFISLRHSRTTLDQNYGIDEAIINALPDAVYDVHVHVLVPLRATQVLKQRIEVSEFGAVAEDEENLEDEGPNAPTLVPGEGFEGKTEQPDAVGNLTTNTMARWDVVPFQEFKGVFEVGVVAHHSYGMDRVVVSFNGGPWRSIESASINPRTNVNEFWAKIDAGEVQDGKVELRAIAYPKHGKPRVLEPLILWANAGGSIDFPVYELGAGRHNLPLDLQSPEDKWLTVRRKPGVALEDCVLSRIRQTKTVNLKIEGVTMLPGGGYQGGGEKGMLWFDDLSYTGVKSNFTAQDKERLTKWPADHNWKKKYYTKVTIDQVQTAFHSGTGIIRNCHVKTAYEDVVRQQGLIVNVTVDRVRAGIPGYVFHPDVFQWYGLHPKNMIVQDFKATNVAGQGLYPNTTLTDCAFVNVDLDITIENRPLQLQDWTHNVLIQDSEMRGPIDGVLRYDKKFSAKDVVFRDSVIGATEPFLPVGWKNHEIKIDPQLEAKPVNNLDQGDD